MDSVKKAGHLILALFVSVHTPMYYPYDQLV